MKTDEALKLLADTMNIAIFNGMTLGQSVELRNNVQAAFTLLTDALQPKPDLINKKAK